eukprot:20956-Heterococcus_DN1.PRE.1
MHANALQQSEQQAHALLEERVLELQKWRAEAHTLAQRLLEEERRTADASRRNVVALIKRSVHGLKCDCLGTHRECAPLHAQGAGSHCLNNHMLLQAPHHSRIIGVHLLCIHLHTHAARIREEAAQATVALAGRRAHMEGLESEAERLRAAAAVVRAELLQTESALARARGDSDRHRAAATAAEQQCIMLAVYSRDWGECRASPHQPTVAANCYLQQHVNTQLAAARAALSEKEAELDHVTSVTRHSEANKEQQRQRLESAHTALRDAEARAAAAGSAADAARRELE